MFLLVFVDFSTGCDYVVAGQKVLGNQEQEQEQEQGQGQEQEQEQETCGPSYTLLPSAPAYLFLTIQPPPTTSSPR